MADRFEATLERAQRTVQAVPAIVLGSGASLPHGIPGMGELRTHLLSAMPNQVVGGQDFEEWNTFADVLDSADLETALQQANLNDRLTRLLVGETWRLLVRFDTDIMLSVAENPKILPLSRLFRHLFDSTKHRVVVVTTNYDRLPNMRLTRSGHPISPAFASD